MTVGARIRSLRKARGLSQEALAQAMGVRQEYISQVECSGEEGRAMSLRALDRFSVALHVPTVALVDDATFTEQTPHTLPGASTPS